MKARVLTKLLNNSGYIVYNNCDCITVGSFLCHDIISVDKKSLNIKYALEPFCNGRQYLEGKNNTELLFIWDKLTELIQSGEIIDIINGQDQIENPLPVFTVYKGILVETFTDKYGWPNTTIDGYIMYVNTYFQTREEAVLYGIKQLNYSIKSTNKKIENLISELNKAKKRLADKEQQQLETLKALL